MKSPRTLRLALLATVACAALPVAPALAQTAEDAASEDTGDIVVVARRREERLIDVPIAVTAMSTDTLAKMSANDLGGVQGAVPNVNIVQGRGSSSNANIFIRGVGQPDALQTFDPAVGVYVDGVYLSRIQGALLNLHDVQRVEVLRGPQGTLYGKNTIGGAVNIVSKKPDFNALKAEASVTFGRFDEITGKAYVSAPLVADKLALSVAGIYDDRDGFVTDPRTGKKYNDRNNLAFRGILRAQPSEALELILSGDYTKQKTGLTLGYATAPLLQTSLFPAAIVTLTPANPYGAYDYKASTSFANDEGQRLKHWGGSLTANLELSDTLTLSSISAYRKLSPDFFVDIDATQFELGDVFVGVRQRQVSQELQLKYDGEALKGVFGVYYLNERIISAQQAYADSLFSLLGGPVTFTRTIADKQTTNSYAAFGQLTYDFTDKLSLTGGLRYTKDKKRYNRITTTSSSLAALNNLTYIFPTNLPAPFTGDDTASYDAWTPMASLSYKPSPDTMIYASASRGFKAVVSTAASTAMPTSPTRWAA